MADSHSEKTAVQRQHDEGASGFLPERYRHDGAFCGRMTKAGFPCQRERLVVYGSCAIHNPLVQSVRSMPSPHELFESAFAGIESAISAWSRYLEHRRRLRYIRREFIEFDAADHPPALPPP